MQTELIIVAAVAFTGGLAAQNLTVAAYAAVRRFARLARFDYVRLKHSLSEIGKAA